MATSVKTDLTRFMTTADSLVHFEAITDAPGAPYPPVESVAITSIPCGKDCIVAVGDTKSILKSQYWIVNGTNPKRSLPGTLSSSNSVPKFRDLFTAKYIDNPILTPVEKLFHLNSKTSGEPHS